MNSQGYSNGSSVGTGNACTKFSITGTILREIAHVRKRYDNPGESTIWRAPASRAVGFVENSCQRASVFALIVVCVAMESRIHACMKGSDAETGRFFWNNRIAD